MEASILNAPSNHALSGVRPSSATSPNGRVLRALWSLVDGMWGVSKGSWRGAGLELQKRGTPDSTRALFFKEMNCLFYGKKKKIYHLNSNYNPKGSCLFPYQRPLSKSTLVSTTTHGSSVRLCNLHHRSIGLQNCWLCFVGSSQGSG